MREVTFITLFQNIQDGQGQKQVKNFLKINSVILDVFCGLEMSMIRWEMSRLERMICPTATFFRQLN